MKNNITFLKTVPIPYPSSKNNQYKIKHKTQLTMWKYRQNQSQTTVERVRSPHSVCKYATPVRSTETSKSSRHPRSSSFKHSTIRVDCDTFVRKISDSDHIGVHISRNVAVVVVVVWSFVGCTADTHRTTVPWAKNRFQHLCPQPESVCNMHSKVFRAFVDLLLLSPT